MENHKESLGYLKIKKYQLTIEKYFRQVEETGKKYIIREDLLTKRKIISFKIT